LSETDSFIEEVTEEVRRDKLFAFFRKYGWIPISLVVIIVAGASYNEWRVSQAEAAARALGDDILTAVELPDPANRADALSKIEPTTKGGKAFMELFRAAAQTEADDKTAALALLDTLAKTQDVPQIYRDLARLKAVIMRASDQDKTERLAILDDLATAGNPFRVIALEQKALVYAEFGNNADAIATLKTILEEPQATQGLLQRAQQLIVVLGGTVAKTGSAANGG